MKSAGNAALETYVSAALRPNTFHPGSGSASSSGRSAEPYSVPMAPVSTENATPTINTVKSPSRLRRATASAMVPISG